MRTLTAILVALAVLMTTSTPSARPRIGVDVDRDGRFDLVFYYSGTAIDFPPNDAAGVFTLFMIPKGPVAIHKSDNCGTCPLDKGAAIDSTLGWTNAEVVLGSIQFGGSQESKWEGPWIGQDKIIGLRLRRGVYAWLRISCSEGTGDLVIHQVSEFRPNATLRAGEWTR